MLEDYLLDHRALTIALALAMTGANVSVVLAGQRLYGAQQSFRYQGYEPSATPRFARQVIAPFAFSVALAALSLLMDREGFGALAGGLLVMQSVVALTSASSLLNWRAVRRPGLVVGEVTYSTEYRYLAYANALLVGTAVTWVAFTLRGGPMLFGGGALLSALVIGYRRRARQMRRRPATDSGPADV
jgi:hypothetical protein